MVTCEGEMEFGDAKDLKAVHARSILTFRKQDEVSWSHDNCPHGWISHVPHRSMTLSQQCPQRAP